MELIYGYVRVSTAKQNIERQIRNIMSYYPNCYIVKEIYTGTTTNRKEWNKLYANLLKEKGRGNDIKLVFDSVCRLSRNADEGFKLYEDLFNNGIDLIFLKEPHINSDTYKKAISIDIKMTGTNADILLNGIKDYLLALAKEQIKIAFMQAENEVNNIHKRTSEGIMTAKLNGKQIGRIRGEKYPSKKEKISKELILKNSKDFFGYNNDSDVIKICGISRNTFYKYKKELTLDNG